MRSDFTVLPAELRAAIEAESGPVRRIQGAPAGDHADFAATLYTGDGRIFVKAARKPADRDGPEVKPLRREAASTRMSPSSLPGFGGPSRSGGGSPSGSSTSRAAGPTSPPGRRTRRCSPRPCTPFRRRRVRRWRPWPWNGAGRRCQKTSPRCVGRPCCTPTSTKTTSSSHRRGVLVDWAFVSRGAAWLEPAMLLPWLIGAGHSPRQADEWAGRFPSWAQADPAHIDLWSRAIARQWHARSTAAGAAAWTIRHAGLVQRWADYRLRGRSS